MFTITRRALSEFRSCVKVELAVLGTPSIISLMVSVGVKQHERRKRIERKKKADSFVLV